MLSKTISRENYGKKTYVESSLKYHLFRDVSNGFSSKWSGVWFENRKLLDYFAFNIDGEWLDSLKFKKKTGYSVHEYMDINNMAVVERVFSHDRGFVSLVSLKNKGKTKKTCNMEIEVGINIRTKEENYHERDYITKIDHIRPMFSVSPENDVDFSVFIGTSSGDSRTLNGIKGVDLIHIEKYKIHYPEEKQRCYIPIRFVVSLEIAGSSEVKVPLVITTDKEDFDFLSNNFIMALEEKKNHSIEKILENELRFDKGTLDESFSWSILAIDELKKNISGRTSFFAGFPWFLEFWSRDVLWACLALLDLGEFSTVKDILKDLMVLYLDENKDQDKGKRGLIPSQIINNKVTYYNSDVNPLFLIVLNKYAKITGDYLLVNDNYEIIDKIIKNINIEGNKVKPMKYGSWMDTLERDGYLIEIQSLWIEALRNQILGEKLKEGLGDFFDPELGSYKDSSEGKNVTANVLVPLMFGQTNKANTIKTLEYVKKNLLGSYGIRTLDKTNKDYQSSGYHTGASWGLTTGWGACAFLRNDDIDTGISLLNIMAKEIQENGIGGMNECVDSEFGNLIGASSQLWSSAMYIHSIDGYLLGIDANVLRKEIRLKPKIREGMSVERRAKKIGKGEVDLKMEYKGGKFFMDLKFYEIDDDYILKIELPSNFNNINIKHGTSIDREKRIKGHKCILLVKENVVLEAS